MSRLATVAGRPRHLAGWRPDRPDHRDLALPAPKTAIPDRARLETMPPVLDQGSIGSCTANMGCTMLAFLERKGPESLLFSRLFLYARTRQLEGTPLTEDSGAEIRDVLKALARFGVCYEVTWPYTKPEVRFVVEPSDVAIKEAAEHKALFYYRCPDLFTIKASIAQGFPVGFGFSVPENMMSDDCARTGLVYYPGSRERFNGGHATTIMAFDDAFKVGNDVGAVECQNSWGPEWGLQGRFWLPYRFFNEKLADDCWTLRRAEV